MPLTGGCACGALRYRVATFPSLLYACHCTDCQRQSGSAFAMSMTVATSGFELTQGTPKPWSRASRGAQATAWFCGDCGIRIYGTRDSRPNTVNIRAGTLDDTTWMQPSAHLFMRSAQPWERIDDADGCYDTLPADFDDIAARWRAQWTD